MTDDHETEDRETGDPESEDTTGGDGAPGPEEDPFEQFEADVGDREGDPFERLPDEGESGAGGPGDAAHEIGGPGDAAHDATGGEESPVDETGSESTADTTHLDDSAASSGTEDVTESGMAFDVGGTAPRSEDSDPFGDAVDREGDPFESLDGAFEEMDVGAVDPETVWQDLASAEARGTVGDPGRRTYAEVSKHSYCEQCEYFSGPPEIACRHEGTEIVEFIDMETVRVVDCPIVAERAELQAKRSVASQDEDER